MLHILSGTLSRATQKIVVSGHPSLFDSLRHSSTSTSVNMLSWTSIGSRRRATLNIVAMGLIVSGDPENLGVGDETALYLDIFRNAKFPIYPLEYWKPYRVTLVHSYRNRGCGGDNFHQ